MSNLFYTNRRLLVLTLFMILVAGLSAFRMLPRLEDPRLTPRGARITTFYPGASADRVEALVTNKIEENLLEFKEIKNIESSSRNGISVIVIRLVDEVTPEEVPQIWSRIRDNVDESESELPTGAAKPEFDTAFFGGAYTTVVALTWDLDSPVVWSVLQRHAEELEDRFKLLRGTEYTDIYGENPEEVLVELDPTRIAALGLSAADVATAIAQSDVKIPAGTLRNDENNLQIEIEGELDSLDRLRAVPISLGPEDQVVRLGDIARIEKGIANPPAELAIIDGKRAVVVGARMFHSERIDNWTRRAKKEIGDFEAFLPSGVGLKITFDQNQYTEARFEHLYGNLRLGGGLVVIVVLIMMGWRSALIVSTALPLTVLAVLAVMNAYGMPLHQMSMTGMIIALGLLIDNAIVMVDEVEQRMADGEGTAEAISSAVKHLSVPLLGSTLTTIFAFAPVALLPGPAGEFVGPIAVTVTISLICSLAIALTLVPALKGLLHGLQGQGHPSRWYHSGISIAPLAKAYSRTLGYLFERPYIGLLLAPVLPICGFVLAQTLEEQFFPPSERDQFQVQLRLPSQRSIEYTLAEVHRARELILRHPLIEDVDFYVGGNAPEYYYNMISNDESSANFAQAIVKMVSNEAYSETINALQDQFDNAFPEAQPLVLQFEQGPPFAAPIEIRVKGPDLDVLREVGDKLRKYLSRTPGVVHTQSSLSAGRPKLFLSIDEEEARMAGLTNVEIARQLNANLEGIQGGSILEVTEELPVRVRVTSDRREKVEGIASLDLFPVGQGAARSGSEPIPLTALGSLELRPQQSTIWHRDGVRVNNVRAYLRSGVLPQTVLSRFQTILEKDPIDPPAGYVLEAGGEASERNEAVGKLLGNLGLLLVLMIATLVLSMGSFRLAAVIGVVGFLSIGMGLFAIWVFQFPFGFMAMVGTMGLVGIAFNDAIVVMAALRENERCLEGDVAEVRDVVVRSTRHVISTTFTTVAGFTPLVLSGGGMWPPPAVAIAGGVLGATMLALIFVPSAFVLTRRGFRRPVGASAPASQAPEAATSALTTAPPDAEPALRAGAVD